MLRVIAADVDVQWAAPYALGSRSALYVKSPRPTICATSTPSCNLVAQSHVVYEVIFMHPLLSARLLLDVVAPASVTARTTAQDLSVAQPAWWPQ
jgi:hypothetical protein